MAQAVIAGECRPRGKWTAVLLAGLLALVVGCNSAETPRGEPKTGRELLERMVDAYRRTKTYADAGEVRQYFVLSGEVRDSKFNFSLTLERPNKLRLQAYEATVVCDGKKLHAAIDTLPDQMLERDAPAAITREDVYGDQALYETIIHGVASGSLQLALLTDPDPLGPILEGADTPALLPVQMIDGAPCLGVKLVRPDGKLIFWIDQATYALRRAEYPVDEFERELKKMGQVREVSMVADFKGATLGQPVSPLAFQFEPAKGARPVKRFEAVARPEPLSPLLGQKIPSFRFTTLDGQPVTHESLRGKVAILDFWATWCGPCFQSMPNLNTVYERYKTNDRVVFLAVSIDTPLAKRPPAATGVAGNNADPGVTDDEVKAALQRAKLNLPIVRDLEQHAKSVFGVEKIPTMYILGPAGTVEDHEVGLNPELATDLPPRIEKLLAGGSLKEDALRRHDARIRQYETQFQTPGAGSEPELTRAPIAPKSQPVALKLNQAWQLSTLKEPGNVLTYLDGNQPKLLVHDGWKKVVELSTTGQVFKERELTLPGQLEEGLVTYLRTAVDGSGKRWFVGGASTRQQIHVFDANWQRTLSFPEEKSAGGIADVQLADLDGDGQLELNIGYYDVVGVQNVTLEGRRRWGVRSITNIYRTAVSDADADGKRALLCTHDRGTLALLSYQGQEAPPITIGTRFIRAIYAEDLDGDGFKELLAISATAPGHDTLVGLDRGGREVWSYPLPVGLQGHPGVEMVTFGKLVGDASQWVIAAADGSIHLLSAEGTPIDRFNFGAAIAGIGVLAGEKPALVVSHGGGVEAWQVVK